MTLATPGTRRAVEVLAAVSGVAVLVSALREPLLQGHSTFTHDVLYWCFPIYHFLADSLLQGRFPYWNPFSHAGEPFYPILLQLRFLEPVTLFGTWLGGLFTQDLLILFNWDRVARGLVAATGTYLLLRRWATHWFTRISLIPVVLWSSLLLGAFRQNAAVDAFISAPYVAYFLFRIVESRGAGWATWIGLGISVGIASQSYFFAPIAVFLLLALAGLVLFERAGLREVMRQPGFGRRLAVTGALCAAMTAPNVAVLLERGDYVFPARMVDFPYRGHPPIGQPLFYEPGPSAEAESQIFMPYALVKFSGTAGNLWNLVQLITPDANPAVRGPQPETFGAPSEAFLYLGLLVYAGALLGLLAGRHRFKRVWLLIGGGLALLFLGPGGGLHIVLYHLYPPLWFMRHTHVFGSFLALALLYFYVLGANELVAWQTRPLFPGGAARAAGGRFARFATATFFVLVLAGLAVTVVTDPRALHSPSLWPYAGLALVVGTTLTLLFRSRLGDPVLFWSLLAAHTLTVVLLSPLPAVVAARLAIFLLLPVGLVTLARWARPALFRPMLLVLVVMLAVDLIEYLHGSSALWTVPRPDRLAAFLSGPTPPAFPASRRVTAGDLGQPHLQSIRYLELLSRTPTAFSNVIRTKDSPETPSVEDALGLPRWNTLLMPRAYFDVVHADIPAHVLAHTLAIDRPLLTFRPAAPSRHRVRVVRYDHDTLDLEIENTGPGVLEYADGYHRHWTALVDGRPVPVVRVDGVFKGVRLEPGQHTVRWRYDPVPFRIALYLFFGAPVVAVALASGAAIHRWATSRAAGASRVAASLPVKLS